MTKNFKKILSVVLAVMMLASSVSAMGLAADVTECEHKNKTLISTTKQYCHIEGTATYKCNDCGEAEIIVIVPVQEHDWNAWSVLEAAQCTVDGIESRTCKKCTYIDKRPITAPGHKYVVFDGGKAPTCTEDGYTAKQKCSTCGDEAPYNTISAPGHKDTNADNRCEVCNAYFTEEMPEGCSCLCHQQSGLLSVLYKIIITICQLFGFWDTCACGAAHFTVE